MGVEPNDTHMLLLLLFSSFQTLGAWKNNNKQSKKTSEQGFTMSVRPSVCLCVYDESFDAPSSSFYAVYFSFFLLLGSCTATRVHYRYQLVKTRGLDKGLYPITTSCSSE